MIYYKSKNMIMNKWHTSPIDSEHVRFFIMGEGGDEGAVSTRGGGARADAGVHRGRSRRVGLIRRRATGEREG